MSTNSRINLAIVLMGLYGVFVLVNALVYYFVLLPGETDIFRGILMVVGVGLIIFYVLKRNRFIYWFAFIGSGVFVVLGFLSVILISSSMGFDIESMINLIPVILLTGTFTLLLPREVRGEFK